MTQLRPISILFFQAKAEKAKRKAIQAAKVRSLSEAPSDYNTKYF